MGNINDDLLYFDIPTWAVTSLVNSDDSGLEDDDIKKLNKFTDEIVAKYGNANFMMGSDEEMESQFKYKNDIDGVLGADVVTMYLQPTKNYAKGNTIKGGGVGDDFAIAENSIKMLNELHKEKNIDKRKALHSAMFKFDKENEIGLDNDNIIYIRGNKVARLISLNKSTFGVEKYAKGTTVKGMQVLEISIEQGKSRSIPKVKRIGSSYPYKNYLGVYSVNTLEEANELVKDISDFIIYKIKYFDGEGVGLPKYAIYIAENNYAKGTTIKFDKLPKNRQANKNDDYFAVGKIDGKIVESWEIVDDVESLKYYAKIDLKDNDYNPKNFNIVSAKYLIRKGINPFDYNNWRKIDYSTNESAYETKFLEGEIYEYGGGIDENDIKQGDYVDFESYGEFYVCNPSYSDNYFWVTKEKEDRYDSNAQGYSVPKSSAIEIIETDEEYADGGGITKKPTQSQLDKMTAFNLMDAMKNDKKNYQLYKKQLLKLYPDAKGFSNGGGIKAIFSKEGIEASNPFAFKKKLEFAKKHPELLMLETGGGVDMYSKFDINKNGTLSATINDKNYEVIYRDDISGMYDLFENDKKIKSSKVIRDLMQFPKKYNNGGGVESEWNPNYTKCIKDIRFKDSLNFFENYTYQYENEYGNVRVFYMDGRGVTMTKDTFDKHFEIGGDYENYAKGTTIEEFNYNPKIDYLSEYHLLPKKVQDIIFKEEYEDSTYESNNKLIKELNGIGWTADYDLSGGMYDLKPIGYEEFSLGGKIDNGYFNNCFLKSIFGV